MSHRQVKTSYTDRCNSVREAFTSLMIPARPTAGVSSDLSHVSPQTTLAWNPGTGDQAPAGAADHYMYQYYYLE